MQSYLWKDTFATVGPCRSQIRPPPVHDHGTLVVLEYDIPGVPLILQVRGPPGPVQRPARPARHAGTAADRLPAHRSHGYRVRPAAPGRDLRHRRAHRDPLRRQRPATDRMGASAGTPNTVNLDHAGTAGP